MMKEPKKLNAGDSRKWSVALSAYPASEWVLAYAIVNASTSIAIDGAAVVVNGDGFDVTLTSPVTAAWTPGDYRLIGYVTKDDERVTFYDEALRIAPDITTASDRRSWAEKTLEAIEAVLSNKATSDQSSISVEGRSLARYSHPDLIMFRDRLKREVRREKVTEHNRKNNRVGGIKVRFQ